MADGLRALGVDATADAGRNGRSRAAGKRRQCSRAARSKSHGDHRIAMSFAMSALRASGPLLIRDTANVATSFPDFPGLASRAGVAVAETRV